jgi:hypothetical protein
VRSLRVLLVCVAFLSPWGAALAQSCPSQTTPALTGGGTVFGRTAAQWNAFFGSKADGCIPTPPTPPPPAGPIVILGGAGSVIAPRTVYVCTTTCTVVVPPPVAAYEFCVVNDDNVSTVITLAALGSAARYETATRTGYGTAGTGTMTSGGAVGDGVCLLGRDATHYIVTSASGIWTNS